VCPVFKKYPDKFVGPLGLVWLAEARANYPKDASDWSEKVKIALKICNSCGKCLGVCPDELNIFAIIFEELRNNKIEDE
jgi:succinate dehydrogenase/fumarate reductase-like Fe-S protein